MMALVCNTDFYTYDGFLWTLRSSVCERTSINDGQVSINHVMISVLNADFLCAIRVICVLCGFSIQLSGLLYAIRVFCVATGFLCSQRLFFVASRFFM